MGSYLLVLYLVSKLFYIANVVSQLFVLNSVLGMTYSTFGIDMIKYVFSLMLVAHDAFATAFELEYIPVIGDVLLIIWRFMTSSYCNYSPVECHVLFSTFDWYQNR